MESGSIRKYLLYALGEILLVMIGILLALQVNNWNEERLARDFERTTLKELQKAIQYDIDYIQGNLLDRRTARFEEAHRYFFRKIKGEKVDPDSLDLNFMWLRFTSQFQYNRGPYESIKSVGLDRIQNDLLRSKITAVYDFEIPRNVELIEWMYGRHEKVTEIHLPPLLQDPQINIINNLVSIDKPMINTIITENSHFLELLDHSIRTTVWTKFRFDDVVNDLEDLNKMITAELDSE